jgi:hypothetical protein
MIIVSSSLSIALITFGATFTLVYLRIQYRKRSQRVPVPPSPQAEIHRVFPHLLIVVLWVNYRHDLKMSDYWLHFLDWDAQFRMNSKMPQKTFQKSNATKHCKRQEHETRVLIQSIKQKPHDWKNLVRRFAKSDSSRHWIRGHYSARRGDAVVASRNRTWPFILRSTLIASGGKVQYRFVGEAFLHGFMQGEIIDQCSEGMRKVEPFKLI